MPIGRLLAADAGASAPPLAGSANRPLTTALAAHVLRTLAWHNQSRALLIVGNGRTTDIAAEPAITTIEARTG